MYEEALQEIGLTGSEIKVYLALLELGDSTRGEIVNISGITGSKAYEVLERLQEKGLVSIYIKNKVKHFKPANPKQILYYLENKKEKIESVEDQVNKVLPGLLAQFNSSKEEQEVEIFTGLKGLEIIFREQVDLLKSGELNYVIGGTKGTEEEDVMSFFQKIHRLRTQKKIKTKMLYNLRQKESTERLFSSKDYPGTTTRYITHSSPVSINIYQDRTVIIVFGKKITAIHIKSQDVANSFLEYFKILWQTSKA
ncbi:MAG: helix-turn-helix domain-containing protein [Candidatus Woesearchaeota archaeon]